MADQKNARVIRKANAFEILNHWVMAISFFTLSATGFAYLFHIAGVVSFFGGPMGMKTVHNYAGLVFAASLILTIFSYLIEALSFSGDDMKWLMKGGGYLSRNAAVPPQGKLNAGQKLVYLMVLAAGAAIAVSGLYLWLAPEVKSRTLSMHFLHNAAFDVYLMIVPFHIYLASIASPGSLRIMINGTVPLEWARKRHAKWAARMT
ncbi:MAG: formate dehydrogenase subunit gamma [Nitrospirae bacterium]|nr:formate dehydrogenase subunit gamma [Nitrospirota bacterium]